MVVYKYDVPTVLVDYLSTLSRLGEGLLGSLGCYLGAATKTGGPLSSP